MDEDLRSQISRHARLSAPLAGFLVAAVLAGCGGAKATIKATIDRPAAGYFRLQDPVTVHFDRKVADKDLKVSLTPLAALTLQRLPDRVVIAPIGNWQPGQVYTVSLGGLHSIDDSAALGSWKATFTTQPRTGIAGFQVDGKPVTGQPTLRPTSSLAITFTEAMRTDSLKPIVDGNPVPAERYQWADDAKSVSVSGPWQPYQGHTVGIDGPALTARGDQLTDLATLQTTTTGLEPSNSGSGVGADFKTQSAILTVIDNAGPARPQFGLQAADVVYEYISEYGISRFTLINFNQPAAITGPVRSCRMINTYLLSAFHGVQLCSGASNRTINFLFGDFVPGPKLATIINDYDLGNHFYREGSRPAPHNVFTNLERETRGRQEMNIGAGDYAIDPPHADNGLGSPADAPSVPLHGVRYSYDGGCSCYRPFDSGSARTDAGNGGQQLAVKNVVLLHVNSRDAGWVEDDNGGAHSVWYDMNGHGTAEIYSDGKVVHATWHQGRDGQDYYQDTSQPIFFTDEGGNFIRLNTGLTWLNVLGSSQ